MDNIKQYYAGIDIGSTTAKLVIFDHEQNMVFSDYRRHHAKILETLRDILKEVIESLGDITIDITITGSAGMGISDAYNIPFVQEVVASAYYIKKNHEDIRTFIEIGGEDSKIIFFDDNGGMDIRMNGSCAGGTGAFIEQMSVLLDVPVTTFNDMAKNADSIYPIASRCGVFAKTDVQTLLSRDISKENVAASIFYAVATQVISALSMGRDINRKILLGGGPLYFYPYLRTALMNILKINDQDDIIIPDHAELIPAMGIALGHADTPFTVSIKELLLKMGYNRSSIKNNTIRLPSLFKNKREYEEWETDHAKDMVLRTTIEENKDNPLFLGIDSGSTTTKLVITDENARFVYGHYASNKGAPIETVRDGLQQINNAFIKKGFSPPIVRSAVTGYGEDLIKAAFGIDDGVVETLAHFRAARLFDKDVSFILDIGGQDMKAIFVDNRGIADIQINEACSSGCGSFIETFASSLGCSVEDFASIGCNDNMPFDLGTRCTVFMNSKVKQALREGASIGDISSGLAYSVIKNSLYKVLQLKDTAILGEHILVQGGTFRNPSVLRSIELLLGKKVIRPDIPELMGAYGAAITAMQNHRCMSDKTGTLKKFADFQPEVNFSKKEIECKGCENHCYVMRLEFDNGNIFYTGNRCESIFSNGQKALSKGKNFIAEKLKLLFDRKTEPDNEPILTFGIPRVLNMYENFPFWAAFFVECGFKVVISSPSSHKIYEKGIRTVMSDNICFPAKLAHGHVYDLIDKGVDRIFLPNVVYEKIEYKDGCNSYNCPVVTGYPDVLKSAVSTEQKFNIPFDNPAISFKDSELLKKQLHLFLRQFQIDYKKVVKGVNAGLAAQHEFKTKLIKKGDIIIKKAEEQGRRLVVLAGHPYHIDPLINHGIPELLTGMGVDVIPEDVVSGCYEDPLSELNVFTQWAYTNRLYAAAKWVCEKDSVQLVQMTSFGCGPDAIANDEVRDIINSCGKIYTLIKMDEIANLGAVKIRLRSTLEATIENEANDNNGAGIKKKVIINRKFMHTDRDRVLIAPYVSEFYSPLMPSLLRSQGYRVDVLPPQDKVSAELGLKNINNDVCYPAQLIAGDIIKAFETGKYDKDKTAVILSQTGGQCRATNYISLIKRALFNVGLSDVPVVAISMDDYNAQPGFVIDEKEFIKRAAFSIIFSDAIAQMYLSTIVRELNPGSAKALHAKYLSYMEWGVEEANYNYLIWLLEKAVDDFNALPVNRHNVPRIGIVGEIFVKYNAFSNGNIVEWLTGQGIEVVLPSLQTFFTQRFINEAFDQKAFLKQSLPDSLKHKLMDFYVKYHLFQIDRIMQGFKYYKKPFKLEELAETTARIVSLSDQSGEGWILTADMIGMINEGIKDIVCLQPFGCIANHITGKGIEKKLKEMYPGVNILFLDMDASASEVNLLNRLHFMVMTAKENKDDHPYMYDPEPVRPFLRPYFYIKNLSMINNYLMPDIEKWKTWMPSIELPKTAIKFIKKYNNVIKMD